GGRLAVGRGRGQGRGGDRYLARVSPVANLVGRPDAVEVGRLGRQAGVVKGGPVARADFRVRAAGGEFALDLITAGTGGGIPAQVGAERDGPGGPGRVAGQLRLQVGRHVRRGERR